MLSKLQRLGQHLIRAITGLLNRLLVFLSLLITVLGCVSFIYGLYSESIFYCIFGVVGSIAFVYVNKQT